MNMPRNKSFNLDKIIEIAMSLFRKKGYSNTSLTDLEKATKLNRVCLYNAFKDKEHLFEACMDKYSEIEIKNLNSLLQNKGLKGLISVFEGFAKKSKKTHKHTMYGCLMVNTCLECANINTKIGRKLEKHQKILNEKFEVAIDEAKKLGEISDKIDAQSNAAYLVTVLYGILVQVRLTQNILAASTTASTVIKTIESWKR